MAQYRPKSIEELLSGSSAGAGAGTGLLSALRSYSSIVDSFARRDYYSTLAEDKSEKYAIDRIDDMLTEAKDLRNISDPDFLDTFSAGIQSMENVSVTPRIEQKVRYASKLYKQARARVDISSDFRDFAYDLMSPGGQLSLEYNMGVNDDAWEEGRREGYYTKKGKKGSSKLVHGDTSNPYNYGGVDAIMEYANKKFKEIQDTGYVDKVTEDMFDEVKLHGYSLDILGFQDRVIQDTFPQRPLIEDEWRQFIRGKSLAQPYKINADNITGSYLTKKESLDRSVIATNAKIQSQVTKWEVSTSDLDTHKNIPKHLQKETQAEYDKETTRLQGIVTKDVEELKTLQAYMGDLKTTRDEYYPLLDPSDTYDWRDMTSSLRPEETDDFTTTDFVNPFAAVDAAEDLIQENLNVVSNNALNKEDKNTYLGVDGEIHTNVPKQPVIITDKPSLVLTPDVINKDLPEELVVSDSAQVVNQMDNIFSTAVGDSAAADSAVINLTYDEKVHEGVDRVEMGKDVYRYHRDDEIWFDSKLNEVEDANLNKSLNDERDKRIRANKKTFTGFDALAVANDEGSDYRNAVDWKGRVEKYEDQLIKEKKGKNIPKTISYLTNQIADYKKKVNDMFQQYELDPYYTD